MKLSKETEITKNEFLRMFRDIPKAELHLHLEAVISRKTILRFYLRRHPELTEKEAEFEIAKIFTYSDLDGFIKAYIAVQDLYDSVDDLDYVFCDLKEYLIRNGIVYAEVFAAPSAFMKKGFDFSKMVEFYRRNILKIKSETGIIVRILIDVSRTFGMENAEKNLQLLLAYRVNEIIGIGLGGSEQKGPARLFGDVFEKARENNLETVAHAGEDVGPESIWDAIDILNVSRIGHGIAAMNDETLMATLAERKIPLEICPTSNIFTQKFVKTLSEHPMHKFFEKGILVTLNTDDPLFFGVELLDEYWNAYSQMGFKISELKTVIQNSFTASFMGQSQKGSYLASFDMAWKNLDMELKKKRNFELNFVKGAMTMIGAPVAAFFLTATFILTGIASNFSEKLAGEILKEGAGGVDVGRNAVINEINAFPGHLRSVLFAVFFLLFVVIVAISTFIITRMRAKEKGAGERLIDETHNLADASKENAATAQEQSTAVKEIVVTMEDNTNLSEDIAQKIKDVSGVASKTSNDVAEGVSYLEENVRQLHEIAKANQSTIEGIKNLGDKIENIWDIVSLINSVADQAKIIAFNAELEASTAGTAGKNFHIVASEIRRLADGIIDGTKEIKERITEIQQSSDSLILASESGTEKIQEGVSNAKNLEIRFGNIKNASEITAASSEDIMTIIQQQASASEQMLITLKQIASGIESFSSATEHISIASQNLQGIAEELSK